MKSNVKFCQSCGMPLADEALYGTNADGSKSDDYCSYCYADGAFKAEVSMEEMIDFCVPHMVEHNPEMQEDEARARMNAFFPTLKRWK